jgi:DNA-binding MarR family transcriptional regulator
MAQATDGPGADVASGLLQLTTLVQAIYACVSERHDLTPVQARLLCVLLDGPRGMAELAHCFGVEKAALTGLMDRAERRGLARRSPVPGDRRALQATLTDAGRRAGRGP